MKYIVISDLKITAQSKGQRADVFMDRPHDLPSAAVHHKLGCFVTYFPLKNSFGYSNPT